MDVRQAALLKFHSVEHYDQETIAAILTHGRVHRFKKKNACMHAHIHPNNVFIALFSATTAQGR